MMVQVVFRRILASLLLIACITHSAQAQLVGYWPFDGDVLDASGTGNDGELVGGDFSNSVPSALGAGQSLSFEEETQHVFVGASPSLNSSIFSLSLWFNDQEQFEGINRLTSRESDTFETGIDIALGSNSLAYYSPAVGWAPTGAVAELDEWNHVAYVADGETMTVYLNGEDVFDSPFSATPSGFMHIGNRWNDIEGFYGLIDDVALWNVPLEASSITQLIQGVSPTEVDAPDPVEPMVPSLTVTSSVDGWMLSDVTEDGGELADWDASGITPPAANTFTLEPIATSSDAIAHINTAASSILAEGIQADNDVHFYRTTFDMCLSEQGFDSAKLQLAVDNGAQVYINGELVATEASFLAENWVGPLPSLNFAADGSVESIKFDEAVTEFDGWINGENEIILSIRNPFEEAIPAGGFAFRLDFFGEGVGVDSCSGLGVHSIDALNAALREGSQSSQFDYNGDGTVDEGDRDTLVLERLNTYYGDSNFDGEFNSSDLVSTFTAGEYEDNLVQNSTWATGDWNGDAEFNSSDFVTAFSGGGYEAGPKAATAAAVPEPTSLWGGIVSLLIVCAIRRRQAR